MKPTQKNQTKQTISRELTKTNRTKLIDPNKKRQTNQTLKPCRDWPGCPKLWRRLPEIENYEIIDLDIEKYVGNDLDTSNDAHRLLEDRYGGTSSKAPRDARVFGKKSGSRIKLDCCQDSILCTFEYMEISDICTFDLYTFVFAPPNPDIVGDARWGILKFAEVFRHDYPSKVKILSPMDICFSYYNF